MVRTFNKDTQKRVKILPRNEDGKNRDPFSPENRDKNLVVGRLTPSHVMMMNKFPVMCDHVRILRF